MSVLSYPLSPVLPLVIRQQAQPFFPDSPSSCPICEQNYGSINSCAQACPVLANFSSVLFNPGAFIDVIKCACTDTFQSVFPQCADCFEKTNQTAVLDTPDLPAVVNGVRQTCEFASSLLGNTSNSDGETTPTKAPAPAPSNGAVALQSRRHVCVFAGISSTAALVLGVLLL
ncbi:hypothetical protein BC834DRAFT_831009 [Gloeopeniophorella convolvens]|nr:hypothetical protein BC834DRAFT_831009 [Gloeopeniophorella convolvens]